MTHDLWICPSCARRFANPNQWHSCVRLALDDHLADKPDSSVAIYRSIEATLHRCGDFRIHPQKTRVAFIARMTFAAVRLATRWADLTFITPSPIGDERIRKIDMYGPTSFNHEVRLSSPPDVDDDIQRWLCTALERGEQETLEPTAEVDPVVGPALERLTVPLHSRVVEGSDGLALKVPGYVLGALAAHPWVRARIQKTEFGGEVRADAGGVMVPEHGVLETLGLGLDNDTDLFIRPDL